MLAKEPNRDDFEAGINQQPKAETLYDFELGTEKKIAALYLRRTFYYMNYQRPVGIIQEKLMMWELYTRTNAPKSYRLGVELQAGQ